MRLILLTVLSLCFSLLAQQPAGLGPDAVVMRIGSRAITRAEFEHLALGLGTEISKEAPAPDTRSLGQMIGRFMALAEEARRRKIDRDPKIDARLKVTQQQLLANLLFNYIVEDVHQDEDAVRKYYETHPSPAEHRKIRHILVRFGAASKQGRTEAAALERARSLRSRIAAGADFAAVAKAESDDEKTKDRGGDLGLSPRGVFLPDFQLAAFRLAVGQVSEPVKTSDGYHLILVEKIVPPTFQEVRKSIEYQMARERADAIVNSVKYNEEYFGKPK